MISNEKKNSPDKKNEKKPRRKINGILLLDKPIGFTSNQALQKVKHLYQAKKAGHTGSLDPLATGMLPLCFGEATKFAQFLLDADKHYFVVAKLGIKTATGDAEGDVVDTKPVPDFSSSDILRVLETFKGPIQQVPSMYSALKHKGQPLYKLARQGIEVERKARTVNISHLELHDQNADSLTLDVKCSKGTYIRTLVEDIGNVLGCLAHVIYLRRLSVAHYDEDQMVTLKTLESQDSLQGLDSYLLPINTALEALSQLTISESAYFYMKQGQSIFIPKSPESGYVRLLLDDGTFVGVGEVGDDAKIVPRRLIKI